MTLNPPHQFRGEAGIREAIEYLRASVRANGSRTLGGVEEEIGLLCQADGTPPSVEQLEAVVIAVVARLGGYTMPVHMDTGETRELSAKFDIGTINVETNTSIIEFAHKAQHNSHAIADQSAKFSAALNEAAHDQGLVAIGTGFMPTATTQDFVRAGRFNYAVIRNKKFEYSLRHIDNATRPEYLRTVFGTASTHHNMGFNDPERMAKFFVTAMYIQPTMVAMLANAPFIGGRRADSLSVRGQAQTEYGSLYIPRAPLEYLYPDALCNLNTDFEGLVRGYMRLPMDRAIVGGRKQSVGSLNMEEYIRNGIDGHFPTVESLQFMFREPIVDVRPEMIEGPRVETRAHDCVSSEMSVAIDAFYRGINENLDEAHALMQRMYMGDVQRLRRQRAITHRLGLRTQVPHRRIVEQADIARELLDIATKGLVQRGLGEDVLLKPMRMILDSQMNPADRLIYSTGCQFNWAALEREMRYTNRIKSVPNSKKPRAPRRPK